MPVRIVLSKTNGLQSSYRQNTSRLAGEFIAKLTPRTLFTRGVIILGTGNPYTLIQPAFVASIQVDSKLAPPGFLPPGVDSAEIVPDRKSFLQKLEERLRTWRRNGAGGPGKPFEALVQLELQGGWERCVQVAGRFADRRAEAKALETLLGMPVLCAQRPGLGMDYINPATIIRARVYHSNTDPFRPQRLLPLDPDDI